MEREYLLGICLVTGEREKGWELSIVPKRVYGIIYIPPFA